MDRFNLNGGNLYGNSVTTYDPGHIPNDSLKGGKNISVKDDKGESILMNKQSYHLQDAYHLHHDSNDKELLLLHSL